MALQDDVRNLAAVPALAELEPEALRLIAFSAETRILRTGEVLFRKGDTSDSGYVLRSGSLAADDGKRAATIVAPPALVGDLALLVETQRAATVTAREPSSVLRISLQLFRRVLTEYPDSAVRLRRALAQGLLAVQRDFNESGLSDGANAFIESSPGSVDPTP